MKNSCLAVSLVLFFLFAFFQTVKSQNPSHVSSIIDGTISGAALDEPQSVYVSGGYAYVVSRNSNALEIINVTNPGLPVHKSTLTNNTVNGTLLTHPVSVYVSGNHAYIASYGSNALEIVDISDPLSPLHIGSLVHGTGGALLDHPVSVFVSGNYAYVASQYSNSLEIIDISNPAIPFHKGNLTNGTGGALLFQPFSVFVSGNFAYLTCYNNFNMGALEIVDISNPANPIHKGKLTNGNGGSLLDTPNSVYVSGKYAYVASSYSNALEIIDISNPSAPVHKGNITNNTINGTLLDTPGSVYISGNYAYVASGNSNALEIVNISDPANPIHHGSISDGEGGSKLQAPSSVFVSGNYVYVTSEGSNTLETFYFKQPISQTILGFNAIPIQTIKDSLLNLSGLYATSFLPITITSSDLSVAIISGSFVKFLSTGVTTITAMQEGNTHLLNQVDYYEAAKPISYVLTITKANQTITGFRSIGTHSLSESKFTIDSVTINSGLEITYTSSYPSVATISGNVITFLSIGVTTITATQMGNNNFNAANSVSQILTIDSVCGPFHAGSVFTGFSPSYVYVSGNYAYLTLWSNLDPFVIYDVTYPSDPNYKGELDDNFTDNSPISEPISVFVSGNYAYVLSYNSWQFDIVDISRPAIPKKKRTLYNGSFGLTPYLKFATSMYVSGNYAYVISGMEGTLEIIDVSDPLSSKDKGSLLVEDTPIYGNNIRSIFVFGNYAYIANYFRNSLEIIDVSDPANPKFKSSIEASDKVLLSGATSVYVSGNYAYVASSTSNALEIIDISNPTKPVHKSSISNNTSTGILLTSPSSVYVSGNYAYVISNGNNTLEVINISNPAIPFHAASVANGINGISLNKPISLFVSGNYIYVANAGGNSLEIIYFSPKCQDIKDPASNHTTTEIIQTDKSISVNIYPNPNSGSFYIEMPTGVQTHGELINSQGQIIRQIEINDKKTEVNSLTPGLYILKIGVETKKIQVE